MRIIIAGDGKTGYALTKQLSSENHEIIVIDTRSHILERTTDRFDVMAVLGNCLTVTTLKEAGIGHADLLIATTGADENNLLCCLIARILNPKIHTIPRVRNPEYLNQLSEMREEFGVSLAVNPDFDAANEAFRILQFPAFMRRETFARGRVEIVELKVNAGDKFENIQISQIPDVSGYKVLVCAITRNGEAFIPSANDVLKAGDHAYVTAPATVLSKMLKNLGLVSKKMHSVLIVGGSRVCYYLAKSLIKTGAHVKIIEQNPEKCAFLAENLPEAIIVNDDGSSQEVLDREGVLSMDALVTLTGLDEMNIIISAYGSVNGVTKIITKINHLESTSLLENMGIGSVISSTNISGNIIAQYVRAMDNLTGAAKSVHRIANEQIEALEFVASENTKYVGVPLKDVPIKSHILVSCITHLGKTFIPDGLSAISVGDTVIVVEDSGNPILQLNDIFKG